ncbi:MAG: S8 family serine peptidase [Clostridia bacterium]|nr:S8 family serine peptidase [Clostridia bacterium]
MIRRFSAIIISLILTASLYIPSLAAEVHVEFEDETVTLIVEVEGDSILTSSEAAKFGVDYLETQAAKEKEEEILSSHMEVMSAISSETNTSVSVGYTYTALFNGFSMEAPLSSIDDIKAIPGVKNVYVDQTETPHLATSVAMTHSLPSETQSDILPEGYTGDGQVIAIIDTEFDVEHEFFSEEPENPKLTKSDIADILSQNELNADVDANQVYKSAKIPFAYDYYNKSSDTYQKSLAHGTHVAGIAAGKNGSFSEDASYDESSVGTSFSGVAPNAQLVLMKASNSSGTLVDSAVIAAAEDAAKLGVCAINMSFGTNYKSAEEDSPLAIVIANAKNAGISVYTSVGNSALGYSTTEADAERPDYSSIGTPAVYNECTAVASADNTYYWSDLGTLTTEDGTSYYYSFSYSADDFGESHDNTIIEYEYCGYGYKSDFEGKDLTGKVALMSRGSVTFVDKANNAAAAGAEAIIVYNTQDGIENFVLANNPPCLSMLMIEKSSGEALRDAENKTLVITNVKSTLIQSSHGGLLSDFTSWGVSDNLELKPEITAPGRNIYSSSPDDTYGSDSGTSMAAPHMTGVAALINEYLDKNGIEISGSERVERIENMLMSTASVIYQPDGVPYSPRAQGAGMVNTAAALTTPAIIIGDALKTKVSLGDNIGSSFTVNFTVKNLTSEEVVYDSLSLDVLTDGYTYSSSDKKYYVTVENSKRLTVVETNLPESITVPADGEIVIPLQITLDEDELSANGEIFTNGFFIDGFISLSSSEEDIPQIGMPFTGFYGDWNAASVLDTTLYDEGGSELEGTYVFTNLIEDGDEDAVICGTDGENYYKDRIAVSPNGDGKGDKLAMRVMAWRNFTNVSLSLQSNDDESIIFSYNSTDSYAKFTSKSFIINDIEDNSEEELPDGEYTLTFSASFNREGAETETITLPVTVDRKAPKLTGANITDNTLTLTACDENYFESFHLLITDENGNVTTNIVAAGAQRGEEASASFDIEGIDIDNIDIVLYDYAQNTTQLRLVNALGNVAASVDYESVGSVTIVNAQLSNISSDAITGSLFIAFYDADGTLIAADSTAISLAAGDVGSYEFNMFADTQNADTIKLFIWDGTSLFPLDSIKSFQL